MKKVLLSLIAVFTLVFGFLPVLGLGVEGLNDIVHADGIKSNLNPW